MNNLITFENENFTLTPIMVDGEPYFLPKEIGLQLGYEDLSHSIKNSDGFIRDIDYKIFTGKALDNIKRAVSSIDCPQQVIGNVKFISFLMLLTESGLYNAIFNSRKPKAKEFRIWVTSEVLPEIRKTGKYEVKKKVENLPFLRDEFKAALDIANLLPVSNNQVYLVAELLYYSLN